MAYFYFCLVYILIVCIMSLQGLGDNGPLTVSFLLLFPAILLYNLSLLLWYSFYHPFCGLKLVLQVSKIPPAFKWITASDKFFKPSFLITYIPKFPIVSFFLILSKFLFFFSIYYTLIIHQYYLYLVFICN